MSMRRLRALAVLVLAVIAAPGIASLAGAAKGGGGGGGGVVPPVVNATNFKATLSQVALPACTGAETNTTATPAVCQTAAPILAAVPPAVPAATVAGAKLRVHVAALDPAKFPLTGCVAEYHIGSVTGSTPLIAALAPEIGNIGDFRTTAAAGTIKSGDKASFDLVCNFTGAPVLGRRGVVVTPGGPIHTETHWSGILV